MKKKDDWLAKMPAPSKTAIPREVLERNPRFNLLVEALADLTPKERKYVRLLPSANYIPKAVLRMMQAEGVKVSEPSIYRWASDPLVQRAVEIQRQLAGEFSGIDALSVILRINEWAAYCAETIDVLDANGNKIGERRRDPANGLKALELLAKHTGALGKEEQAQVREGPGLVIQINATPQQKPAIDVTPERVAITLPEPGK